MTDINVEKIMEEIREDIKKQGLRESDLKFNRTPILESDTRATTEKSLELKMSEEISLAKDMALLNQERIAPGGGRGFFQGVGRKIFKFFGVPTGAEQTHYNVAIMQNTEQLSQLGLDQQEQIDRMEEELEHLRRRLDRMNEKQREQ